MKLLILAVVIFLATADDKYKVRDDIAEEWQKTMESLAEECLKESGQEKEEARDMFKKGYFPNTPKFKHYLKCLTIKLNLMNEEGVFNEELARRTIKAADLDIFEKTLAAVDHERDISEKIYLFNNLFVEQIAKRYPPQH